MGLSIAKRLIAFAGVGCGATALYASLAWTATAVLPLPAAAASLLSYAVAFTASYVGHRRLTFRSAARLRDTAPRFAGLSVAGYAVAVVAPWLLTDRWGAHPGLAILVTCTAVPVLSYLGLSRLVFRGASTVPSPASTR